MRAVLLSFFVLLLSLTLALGGSGCAGSADGGGFGEGGAGSGESGAGGHPDGSGHESGGSSGSGGHKDGGHAKDSAGGGDASGEAGDEGGKGATYTIGGTVSGLAGTGLVLQDNGSDNLSIVKNGSFTFAVPVKSGGAYDVTALIQPVSPAQMCVVKGGTGTVGSSNVTSVVVNCAADAYTIGGTISGLSGTVVLQDNGTDNLTLTTNGPFTFATPIAMGSPYAVTVYTEPSLPSQTCMVTMGAGTVGSADVLSVVVTCTTNSFTIGGMVSGLSGSGLVLQDNGGDNLSITSNGTFTFATPVASGSSYLVTVLTEPSSPTQGCVVAMGASTVTSADVTNVSITCTTSSFTIGGMLSGLAPGDSVVLEDNGGDNLSLATNGGFTFATSIASGLTYEVTVYTQPSSPTPQTCNVSMGSGTVGGSDVTSVSVICTTASSCGRFTTGATGSWATVATPSYLTYGMSGYLPAGGTASFFNGDGTTLEEFIASSDSYTPIASPSVSLNYFWSAGYWGNALWTFQSGDLLEYDIAANTWSTAATGVTTEIYSQTSSDDSGNIWSFASASQLVEYDVAGGTTTYHSLTTALGGSEPRIVYDSCSNLFFLAAYAAAPWYSYNPTTGVQKALTGIPGGLTFQDGFCSDRSGHVYVITSTSGVAYQYDVSSAGWTSLPSGGPSGSVDSTCGVGSDGYLYGTDTGVSSGAMFRILLN